MALYTNGASQKNNKRKVKYTGHVTRHRKTNLLATVGKEKTGMTISFLSFRLKKKHKDEHA